MSPTLLVHFNPNKPFGVGAVLAHQMEDGSSQPICYASRTLSPAEKNYSQLDKEALSIIFEVTRFQQYLFGRHFTLLTDHKPLIYLFHPHRSVPQMVSARIQRWSLILGAHSYDIRYRPGKDHGNADSLRRYHCQYILSKYQYLEMSFSHWQKYKNLWSLPKISPIGLPKILFCPLFFVLSLMDGPTLSTNRSFTLTFPKEMS